jgi:ferric-dicitrate binding protein FerR (iron transport regulator)
MEEINHIEEVNWDLLAKFLSDEASSSEKEEVEAWAGRSGENSAGLTAGEEIMKKARLYYRTRKFDPAAAWEKIEGELTPAVRPLAPRKEEFTRGRWFLRVAASLLLAVALGSAGYFIGIRQHQATVFTEVISNEDHVLQGITLPDGTQVSLNSSSRLTYPKQFSGKTREVHIEGEAFFDVKPDASNPFVITAGNARIKVLGTSFNVNARPGDKTVEVVVKTGKVQVACQGSSQTVESLILVPGERGVLYNDNNQLVKSWNENPNVTAWKTNELVFDKTSLREVIVNLEKVYHTEIQLSDPSLNELVLTAHFDNQPVDFVLEVIRLTFSLELSAQNRQYFLTAAENNPLKQKP